MTFIAGRDAAFAENINTDFSGVVVGYLGGPNAFHAWRPSDWDRFKNNAKVPTWVGGRNADKEIPDLLMALAAHGVPPGKNIPILLDMETRVDAPYCQRIGDAMHEADFRVITYGSASTVFGNPHLNGYMVADWTGSPHMYVRHGVRSTQWAHDLSPGYDVSLWKEWVVAGLWR